MPGMTGRETFLAMQSINPAITALLASGCSVEGDVQAILDQGAKGFLQKPYEIMELSRKLSEVLGGSFGVDATVG